MVTPTGQGTAMAMGDRLSSGLTAGTVTRIPIMGAVAMATDTGTFITAADGTTITSRITFPTGVGLTATPIRMNMADLHMRRLTALTDTGAGTVTASPGPGAGMAAVTRPPLSGRTTSASAILRTLLAGIISPAHTPGAAHASLELEGTRSCTEIVLNLAWPRIAPRLSTTPCGNVMK
jgi:hypothetical protein